MLANKFKLENPEAISSNKLRKQIATVMQISNLSKNEIKQFSDFMGHTMKTHEEFYELPVDVYQTAKVSKILLMMEKGSLRAEYEGKSLSECYEENIPDSDQVILNFKENLEVAPQDKVSTQKIPDDEIPMNEILRESKHLSEKGSDSEYSESIPMKQKNDSQVTKRKGWTDKEVHILKHHFKYFINTKTYPTGSVIKKFAEENKMKRTVPIIKSKLQYLIKLNSTN